MRAQEISSVSHAASPSDQYATPARGRILVADDEPMIRNLNAEVLSDAGYQVDVAEDGAVAWAALQTYHYDLLITDNNMPNVSGLELITKLTAAGLTLPVIMATGCLPEEEFARSPWLQPAVALLKPYTLRELLGAVRKILVNVAQAPLHVAALAGGQPQLVATGLRA
jgi:two-component system, chemotaxis family, chemotaxis protein CheY